MKKLLLVTLSLVSVLSLVGCGKKEDKKTLVGKWAYGSFVYEFKEDKTCSYATRTCTYTVDGDKLSILYDGDTVPFETTFTIENNKLTIKDSFDNDVVYTRK